MDENNTIKGAVILASGYGRRMRKTACFPSKQIGRASCRERV